MYFSLIQAVKFQLVWWTLCSLLMRFQWTYLRSNCTLCGDSRSQTGGSGSWAWWQYGPPFPPFAFSPSLPSSFTSLTTAFVTPSSCIMYNFVRFYRKCYRMRLSEKQLLWNIIPVTQNFMPLEKFVCCELYCWKEGGQCSPARRCTVTTLATHWECRAFAYTERLYVHM